MWFWAVGAAITAALLVWRFFPRRSELVIDGWSSAAAGSAEPEPALGPPTLAQATDRDMAGGDRLQQHILWLHRREASRTETRERLLAALGDAVRSLQRSSEIAGSDRELQRELDWSLDRVHLAMRALRTEIAPLGDVPVERMELVQGLERLCREAQSAARLPVQARIEPAVRGSLTTTQVVQVLYVAREALSNAVRHARASQLALVARVEGGRFVIRISDDGAGFDLAGTPLEGQHGLARMRERAESAGGLLAVQSEQGVGSIVTLTIPGTPASPQ